MLFCSTLVLPPLLWTCFQDKSHAAEKCGLFGVTTTITTTATTATSYHHVFCFYDVLHICSLPNTQKKRDSSACRYVAMIIKSMKNKSKRLMESGDFDTPFLICNTTISLFTYIERAVNLVCEHLRARERQRACTYHMFLVSFIFQLWPEEFNWLCSWLSVFNLLLTFFE